jgi:hypothetical protein
MRATPLGCAAISAKNSIFGFPAHPGDQFLTNAYV